LKGLKDRCYGETNRAGGFARRSLGLTQAVLQGIRTDVFIVAAPIGP
jgi:hypothetical protein